jgi:hypothetical protein
MNTLKYDVQWQNATDDGVNHTARTETVAPAN